MKKGRGSFMATALAVGGQRFRELNPHLFGNDPLRATTDTAARKVGGTVLQADPKERRMRQSHTPKLNQLELEFRVVVNQAHPTTSIHEQAKRYRLANGLWYKPDFTAIIDGREWAWEVKGPKVFRGGFENLKAAASCWPEVRWFLVWKDQSGRWLEQEVLA